MRADIPGKGPVEFEGRLLPNGAKHFEAAVFFGSLPGDIQEWVLDLRYAWARERSAPSALVIRGCDELETRIYNDMQKVNAHLSKLFPDVNPAIIVEEWLSAIMIMRECTERSQLCTWTMRPETGEVEYFLGVAVRIARTMIATQNAQRSPQEQISVPPVFDVIGSLPEQSQIQFINDVMDSLSDERASADVEDKGQS